MFSDNESFFDEKEDISENAFYNIIEYGIDVSQLYIESYIKNMANYNFDNDFEENIYSMIKSQFGSEYDLFSFYDDDDDENDNLIIDVIVQEIMKSVYSKVIPRRSYNKTFIRNKNLDKEKLEKHLDYLKSKPQPDQRTEEWYKTRHNLITASNAWKCFESQANQNQIIYEKCQPIQERSNMGVNINSTLHWGQKYEPISTQLYEYMYDTKVDDFGCIIHDKYHFLGASPDGIVVNKESQRYGRMLEIKNIVNREITRIPKKEYWIQMQLQMEVCNLKECDFLETKFTEYESYDDFYNDGNNFTKSDNLLYKGAIVLFMDGLTPKYFYPDFQIKQEEYNVWYNKIMEDNSHLQFVNVIYWKLELFSCILVLRNKKWFEHSIDQIDNIWKQILYDRENGYEYRAPIKRERKMSISNEKIIDKPNCLIHDSSDEESKKECLIPDSSDDDSVHAPQDLLILDKTTSENISKELNEIVDSNQNKDIEKKDGESKESKKSKQSKNKKEDEKDKTETGFTFKIETTSCSDLDKEILNLIS